METTFPFTKCKQLSCSKLTIKHQGLHHSSLDEFSRVFGNTSQSDGEYLLPTGSCLTNFLLFNFNFNIYYFKVKVGWVCWAVDNTKFNNGMLRHANGRPVIFISLLTYIAPVLRKIPVLPPDVGGRQGKGILRNKGAT